MHNSCAKVKNVLPKSWIIHTWLDYSVAWQNVQFVPFETQIMSTAQTCGPAVLMRVIPISPAWSLQRRRSRVWRKILKTGVSRSVREQTRQRPSSKRMEAGAHVLTCGAVWLLVGREVILWNTCAAWRGFTFQWDEGTQPDQKATLLWTIHVFHPIKAVAKQLNLNK